MMQNAGRVSWSFEEVDAMLKKTMEGIFDHCYATASKYGNPYDLLLGANVSGFEKVADAMMKQGII